MALKMWLAFGGVGDPAVVLFVEIDRASGSAAAARRRSESERIALMVGVPNDVRLYEEVVSDGMVSVGR